MCHDHIRGRVTNPVVWQFGSGHWKKFTEWTLVLSTHVNNPKRVGGHTPKLVVRQSRFEDPFLLPRTDQPHTPLEDLQLKRHIHVKFFFRAAWQRDRRLVSLG